MAKDAAGYRIEFSRHPSGLRARVGGDSSVATTIGYWREIAKVAREQGADALLLVDEMTGTPLEEKDWLDVVLALKDEGLQRLRIAHVKPLGLQQVEFCEIFARDAGIVARVFEDERTADLWLRYGGE